MYLFGTDIGEVMFYDKKNNQKDLYCIKDYVVKKEGEISPRSRLRSHSDSSINANKTEKCIVTSCAFDSENKSWAVGTMEGLILYKNIQNFYNPILLNSIPEKSSKGLPKSTVKSMRFETDKNIYALYENQLIMVKIKSFLLKVNISIEIIIKNAKGLRQMEIVRFRSQTFITLSKDMEIYFIKVSPEIAVIHYANLQELIKSETKSSAGNINTDNIPKSLKSDNKGSIINISWCSNMSDPNKMYCFVFYQNYIFVFLADYQGSKTLTLKNQLPDEKCDGLSEKVIKPGYKTDKKTYALFRELKKIAKEENLKHIENNSNQSIAARIQKETYEEVRKKYIVSDDELSLSEKLSKLSYGNESMIGTLKNSDLTNISNKKSLLSVEKSDRRSLYSSPSYQGETLSPRKESPNIYRIINSLDNNLDSSDKAETSPQKTKTEKSNEKSDARLPNDNKSNHNKKIVCPEKSTIKISFLNKRKLLYSIRSGNVIDNKQLCLLFNDDKSTFLLESLEKYFIMQNSFSSKGNKISEEFNASIELKITQNQQFGINSDNEKKLDEKNSQQKNDTTLNFSKQNANIFTILQISGGLLIFYINHDKQHSIEQNHFSLYNCQILNAKDIANKLMSTSEWLLCLKFCIDFYEGKILNPTKSEIAEMRTLIGNIVIEYITHFHKSEQNNYRMIIRNALECQKKIENYDLMFGKLYTNVHIKQIYWDEQSYFVERYEIKSVLSQKIEEVINGLNEFSAKKLLWFLADNDLYETGNITGFQAYPIALELFLNATTRRTTDLQCLGNSFQV